jgi:hypothetical protein
MVLGFVALLWAGCAGTSERSVSEPMDPMVDLITPEKSVTWGTLDGLFPASVGFPKPLHAVRLGMTLQEAKGAHDALRDPSRLEMNRPVRDVHALGSSVPGYDDVMYTLLVREDVLVAVDVSLPEGESVMALTEAWGVPETVGANENGRSVATWRGSGMRAALTSMTKERAILKFERQAPVGTAN